MDLESAIQHCEEVMMENLEKTKDRNASDPIAINCFECADEHRQLAEWLKELKAYKEQSGDAISRQAAIKAIEALQRPIMREESNYYQFKFSGMSEAREAVENLPSVTPQQRTGRWRKVSMDKYIQHATYYYECSECGDQHIGQVNYCSNCGARMEVEE